MSKENKYASIGLVSWFSEHNQVMEAISTIRAIGVEKFDISYYFLTMERWRYKGKFTESERKEVFLLMADLIEMQKSRIFLNLLTDLWSSMGMAYDFNKKCLVKKGEETICENILEEMRIQAPEIAREIRKWVKNNK